MAWIIEDDQSVAEMVAQVLARAGYGVVLSSTLSDALNRMNQVKDITLVILDLKLPDGSGRELLPWLMQRNDPPDVAVITGYATMEDAVEALRYGVSDFIMKPFGATDIRAMLKRISTRQRIRVGSFIRHLEGIDQRFEAQHDMLVGISNEVSALRDLVHAAIQRKDHA
jgi:DNA-binding NtrC family response regulator